MRTMIGGLYSYYHLIVIVIVAVISWQHTVGFIGWGAFMWRPFCIAKLHHSLSVRLV